MTSQHVNDPPPSFHIFLKIAFRSIVIWVGFEPEAFVWKYSNFRVSGFFYIELNKLK